MTSEKDRKLMLLENLVNNQKHVIELLSMLNSNVEELILDIKDIKNNQKFDSTSNNLGSSSSSELQIGDHLNLKNELLLNNCNQINLHHNHSSNSSSICNANHDHNNENNNTNNVHCHQYQQDHINLDSIDNTHIETQSINSGSNPVVHNRFNKSDNTRIQCSKSANDNFKSVKTGLREFSTFVSKMVRQEFGSNFLAMTRINELDRYVMQKIRDEAIAKYLPYGISQQFAWNHAMNSLRQLRHRQCKKAKITVKTLYVSD